jgi:hypothetical protein
VLRQGPGAGRGASVRRWRLGVLCLLLGGCSTPWILPGDGRSGHAFAVGEELGSIRKISVWFEPGHILEWEVARATDEGRRKLPLESLDYGEVPACMDQVYPKGALEPLRAGQVVMILLDYGDEAGVDPVVPNQVRQWFRKEAYGFVSLTEREASEPRQDSGGEKKHDRP